MDARELRIGNSINALYHHNDSPNPRKFNIPVVVAAVHKDYIVTSIGEIIEIEYLSNITLTKESIERLPSDLGDIEISVTYDGKIVVSVPTTSAEGWTEELPHIKAIHHLQNLYYSRTGTELTFK